VVNIYGSHSVGPVLVHWIGLLGIILICQQVVDWVVGRLLAGPLIFIQVCAANFIHISYAVDMKLDMFPLHDIIIDVKDKTFVLSDFFTVPKVMCP